MGLHVHSTHAQDFLKKHETIKTMYEGPELEAQHACLTLVAAALIVGPDEFALQKFTGFSASFIETVSRRMHAASLWKVTAGEIEYVDVDISQEVADYFSSLLGRPN
jgi:hypothetical protein